MARVTLGHTGRKLQVSPLITVGFLAMTTSAVIRVFGPWQRADLTATLLTVSAALWAVALILISVAGLRALYDALPEGAYWEGLAYIITVVVLAAFLALVVKLVPDRGVHDAPATEEGGDSA